MDATRVRFGSAFEVIVAGGFLAATFIVGSLIVRELRIDRSPLPDRVEEPAPSAIPSAIPTQAISVPVLLLLDGKEIRVGDTIEHIAKLLGPGADVGERGRERGPIGDRVTRLYEHAGTRFLLVLEPFEAKGQLRVAGIYLH